jgi:hypothetical protein
MSSQRAFWQLTDAMTDQKKSDGRHTYWRHKTTGLWWSRDTARHAGCAFKVYKEKSNGDLEWFRDADQYGDFISPQGKHKGPIGRTVTFDATERGNP